jgi:L-threonylcarbamoyladenylate synthase
VAFVETRITTVTLAADNLTVKAGGGTPELQRETSGRRGRVLEICSHEDVSRVAAAVLAGEVVAYPTESFYALGADPRDARALERVVAMKGRDAGKPLLLIADSMAMLREWVTSEPPSLGPIAQHFWPGPLTVVMRARAGVHEALIGAEGTIAVRLSPHPTALALVECCAVALTGTSANRAGEPPPRTAAQVRDTFSHQEVGEILDGGETAGGPPSTLLDLTVEPYRILRSGAVSDEQIAAVMRLL